MQARLDMASLWHDPLEVAAAKLAGWDENRAAAVIRLCGAPCPFTASDFPSAALDVAGAAARIRVA
jgi:hypothetical protein